MATKDTKVKIDDLGLENGIGAEDFKTILSNNQANKEPRLKITGFYVSKKSGKAYFQLDRPFHFYISEENEPRDWLYFFELPVLFTYFNTTPGLSLDDLQFEGHEAGRAIDNFTRLYTSNNPSLPFQPVIFNTELFDYQKEAVMRLLSIMFYRHEFYKAGILSDDMGMGKTVELLSTLMTAIKNASMLKIVADTSSNMYNILIVAPASVLHEWERMIRDYTPWGELYVKRGEKDWIEKWQQLPQVTDKILADKRLEARKQGKAPIVEGASLYKTRIMLVSYSALKDVYKHFGKDKWTFLVFDEAHKLKDVKSNTYKVAKKFQYDFALLATGTPIVNKPTDIYALMSFAIPYLHMGFYYKWQKRYENYSVGYRYSKGRRIEYLKFEGPNMETIHELTSMLLPILIRRKLEASYMPKYRREFRFLKIDEANKKMLSIKEAYERLGFKQLAGKKLTKKEREHISHILQELGIYKAKHIVPELEKAIENMIESYMLAGKWVESMVIFTRFHQTTDLLKEKLEEVIKRINKKYRTLYPDRWVDIPEQIPVLDGRTNIKKRTGLIKDIKAGKYPIILASIRAAGVGINLPTTNRLIMLEPDFTPAYNQQAEKRIRRVDSQHRHVTFEYIFIASSYDTRLRHILDHKNLSISAVLVEPVESLTRYQSQEEKENAEEIAMAMWEKLGIDPHQRIIKDNNQDIYESFRKKRQHENIRQPKAQTNPLFGNYGNYIKPKKKNKGLR